MPKALPYSSWHFPRLPANTPVKCDYTIFFHPLWLDCLVAKQAVDTELEIVFLNHPFLSDLYFKISIAKI